MCTSMYVCISQLIDSQLDSHQLTDDLATYIYVAYMWLYPFSVLAVAVIACMPSF